MQASELITAGGATITKHRSTIALLRRLQPRRGTLVADCRHGGTVASGPLPRQSAPLMGAFVAAGREILVGGVLILVRASLIAFTGALVVIRPRLILITGALVVIRPRLILITRGLVAINHRVATG